MKGKLSPRQIETLCNLYSAGIPKATLARHFGISKPAIEYHVCTVKQLPIEEVARMVDNHFKRVEQAQAA